MSVLIRVEDEPPRSRLDYFRHVVADTFVPFECGSTLIAT